MTCTKQTLKRVSKYFIMGMVIFTSLVYIPSRSIQPKEILMILLASITAFILLEDNPCNTVV